MALGNENGVDGLSVDGVTKLNFLVAGSSAFFSSDSVLALLVIPNLNGVVVVLVVVAVVAEAASLFVSPLDSTLLSVALGGAPKINPVLAGFVVDVNLSSSLESLVALSSFCPNVKGVVVPLLDLPPNNEVVS